MSSSDSPPAPQASVIPTRAGNDAFSPQRAPRWVVWLALILLVGYGGFLSAHMTTVAGGADSSGYMNSAKLFAEGDVRTPLRRPPEFAPVELNRRHFVPAGFDTFPTSSDLAPTYPTGLPLHLAFGATLLGWKAGPFAVQLIAALAAVWLCYVAARELGLDASLAAAGGAMLAAFPVFIFTSFQTLSDTLATTWAVAAVACALRAPRGNVWAIGCGASLAFAVLVRPTNVLLAPALVILLGFDFKRLLSFIVGGIPGAVFLALYNHFVFGGALRSGYGPIFEAFGAQYVAPTTVHFAKWLAAFLPPVMLLLPFAALLHRDTRGRPLLGFAILATTIIGFYLFCSFSHDSWTYLRYILPALPALILAGLLGVEAIARRCAEDRSRRFRRIAALVLTLWAAGNSWYAMRSLHVLYVPLYEKAYADAAQLVRQHVPEHALVVCCNFSGTIYYYTQLPTLLFDAVQPEEFVRYEQLARGARRPIYAALFDIEEEEALRQKCIGKWGRVASAGNITIWKLE